MPYYAKKKPYKKFYKKRTKNYRKGQNFSVAVSTRSPLPNIFKTKLRYSESFKIDNGIAGVAVNAFSCNDLYDPNSTGVGHAPRGYDQLREFYDHWRVLGAKMTLRVVSGNSDQGQLFGISIRDSATAQTSYTDYMESSDVKSRVLGTNDGSGVGVLTYSICPYKWLGIEKTEDTYRGSRSTSPTEECHFHVFTQCLDTSVDSSALQCNVVIDYIVEFFEPKVLSQSTAP